MSTTTLMAGAAFAFVAAALYMFLGYRLGGREVSAEGALPAQMFAAWWLALGASTASGGLMTLLAAAGYTTLTLFLALTYLNLILISVALCGLLYYLIYLYTGLRNILAPLAGFYVAFFVLLVVFIQYSNPIGVEVRPWSTALDYERQVGGVFLIVIIALLLLPQLIAAAMYLSLLLKVRGATQRYRIALVSCSIMVWFGSALASSGAGLSGNVTWQLASRFIAMAAALTILMAYYPPKWVQKRWGIASIREAHGAAPAR